MLYFDTCKDVGQPTFALYPANAQEKASPNPLNNRALKSVNLSVPIIDIERRAGRPNFLGHKNDSR